MKVRDEVDIETLNKNITNIVNETTNSVNTTVVNANQLNFDSVTCHSGTFKAGQTISGEVVVDINFTNEEQTDISNQISALIDATIDKEVKATSELGSGWGDFSQKNQDVSTLFKEKMKNIVSTSAINRIVNTAQTNVNNQNFQDMENVEMDPCGIKDIESAADRALLLDACEIDGEPPLCIDASQNIAVDVFVTAITDNIMESIADMEVDLETVLTANTVSNTSSTGLVSIVDSIMSFFNNPVVLIIFAIVVVVMFVLFLRKKGGGKNNANALVAAFMASKSKTGN